MDWWRQKGRPKHRDLSFLPSYLRYELLSIPLERDAAAPWYWILWKWPSLSWIHSIRPVRGRFDNWRWRWRWTIQDKTTNSCFTTGRFTLRKWASNEKQSLRRPQVIEREMSIMGNKNLLKTKISLMQRSPSVVLEKSTPQRSTRSLELIRTWDKTLMLWSWMRSSNLSRTWNLQSETFFELQLNYLILKDWSHHRRWYYEDVLGCCCKNFA